ncbi:MAG TPA: hypothetical protein VIU37_05015, partial [Candidatus Limnocylindrales bacterium]
MAGVKKLPGVDELKALRRDGKTYKEIADTYGATPGAVYFAMRRAGLTRRQVCPSCGIGTVRATFQVLITYPPANFGPPPPDSDSFVSAECDNLACPDGLAGDGDGRLRRAYLVRERDDNGVPIPA